MFANMHTFQVATKQDLLPALLHALSSRSSAVCVDTLELLEVMMDHPKCSQVSMDLFTMKEVPCLMA